MGKDATKIFGGPAAIIEIDTASNFASAVILGYAGPEVSIMFEKVVHETLSGGLFQSRGTMKWSMKLQQTDDTTIAALKAARVAENYIRVTDYNGNVFTGLVAMLLTYSIAQPFNSSDEHSILVEGQIQVEEPDDAINYLA